MGGGFRNASSALNWISTFYIFIFMIFFPALTAMSYLLTLRKTSGGISSDVTFVTFRIICLNDIVFISLISASLNCRYLQEKDIY
jgi:hypothetical protein